MTTKNKTQKGEEKMEINHYGIDKIERIRLQHYGTDKKEDVYDMAYDLACFCACHGIPFTKLITKVKVQAKRAGLPISTF